MDFQSVRFGYLEEDNFSINKKVSCGMRNLYSRYKDLSNHDAVGYFEEDVIQIKDGRKNIRVYNLTTRTLAVHIQLCGKTRRAGLMFEYIRASVLDTLSGKTCQARSQAKKGKLSDNSCPKWMRAGIV